MGGLAVPASADPAPDSPSADAPGQAGDRPGGNNGVLKVDGYDLDDPAVNDKPGQGHRDNEPHVSCTFNLDWYGFERSSGSSEVTFALIGPGGKHELDLDSSVSLESDGNTDADDQDATQSYSLIGAIEQAAEQYGLDPNDQQGWHLKVTVDTEDGSHGASKKHKVFWIDDDCGGGPTTTRGDSGNDPVILSLATTTTTAAPAVEATTIVAEETTVPVEVLGVQLARTGTGTRDLLMLAGLVMLLGGAMLAAGRREEDEERA